MAKLTLVSRKRGRLEDALAKELLALFDEFIADPVLSEEMIAILRQASNLLSDILSNVHSIGVASLRFNHYKLLSATCKVEQLQRAAGKYPSMWRILELEEKLR